MNLDMTARGAARSFPHWLRGHVEAGVESETCSGEGQQSPGGVQHRPLVEQFLRMLPFLVFAFIHLFASAQLFRLLDLVVELAVDVLHEDEREGHDAAGGKSG